MTEKKKYYPELNAKINFPEMEKNILNFWEEDKTFEKSVHNRDGAAEFVFYDGPPFANGTPHYGHIMVSYVKDAVARFQTMNGKKVERRLGWDCHGLPAEMSAEKQLGVSGRKQIEGYGIEKFNNFCRTDVLKYSNIWVDMFKRIGRWVDFSHDYKTMNLPFMESVIHNFKELYDKGLVYEDYRVLPYSWAAETPLSNFEVNLGYQEKVDNAITVMFKLANGVVVLSEQDKADAIYSNDSNTFWPTQQVGYLCDRHTLVEVERVPAEVVAGFYFYHAGEFYTTEANLTALAKARAPELASLVFVKMAETEQLDDATLTEHAEQFSEWAYPVAYAVKAICSYKGKLYRCVQAHSSQADWTPPATASLWKEIGDPTVEYPEWSQPLGAHDAYALGDKVAHNGKHWVSTAANNVWEPGVYGWEEVTE